MATLEDKCEEYLVELEVLKSSRPPAFVKEDEDAPPLSKDEKCLEEDDPKHQTTALEGKIHVAL